MIEIKESARGAILDKTNQLKLAATDLEVGVRCLIKGEIVTPLAAFRANSRSEAPFIWTSNNLVAPSPSAAMAFAKNIDTSSTTASNF